MRILFIMLTASALTLVTLSGCSTTREIQIPSVEQLYAEALEKFNQENYLEAIQDFKTITIQYQGSEVADKAQFQLAECRFRREEFILAAAEYDILIRTMPSSPLVSKARFQKAMSYYNLSPKPQLDQKYTTQAIDEFQSFIEYSPADSLVKPAATMIDELNNRLAEKDYQNALLYYRMEYYKAAIAYFDYVLEHHHDSKYAPDAMLGKARSLYARKDYAGASRTIETFATRFPDSPLKEDVADLRNEIQTASTGH